MSKNKKKNNKKKNEIIFYSIVYILGCFFVIHFSSVISAGDDVFSFYKKYSEFINKPFRLSDIHFSIYTARFLLLWTFSFVFIIMLNKTKNKAFMPGKEYGDAKWANIDKINKKFADSREHCNRIYSENVRIGMDGDVTRINNNVLTIGGSGAGKSFFLLTPNVYQANTEDIFPGSYVFTDPKGELLQKNGAFLENRGYKIKVVNLCPDTLGESDCYNPFDYIKSEADVNKLITNLFANTTPKDATKGDPFWEKAESMFLESLFLYVWLEAERLGIPKNFCSVLDLLNLAEVNEDEQSELDILFEQLVEDTKDRKKGGGKKHPAYIKYHKSVGGAADTVRSIIISANSRLAIFENEEIRRLLSKDELDLGSIGTGRVDGKENVRTALFCVIPDSDTTYNCIAGMIYTQLFQELYSLADNVYKGKLPVPVTFWLDEFANIALPENFTKLLATMRSRLISCVIIIQNLAQIKKMYEKDWEVLPGNCDTLVYLGGNEQSTHEYISKNLGKCTIWKKSQSKSRGRNGSTSNSEDILGRELMTPDEVRRLDNSKCIVFIKGQDPILDDKFKTLDSPYFEESKKLGLYIHSEHKNNGYDNQYEVTINSDTYDDFIYNTGGLNSSDIEQIINEAKARVDLVEAEELNSLSINIDDLSIEEILAIEGIEFKESELIEILAGVSDGLSDEEIKSYILYENAERMRAKRLTITAFKQRKTKQQGE